MVSLGAGRAGEPAKNRPAVVVSVDELNGDGDGDDTLIVVVPLSSSRAPSALRPEIPPGAGIDRQCRAICRAVRSLSRQRFLGHVGTLAPNRLVEIDHALSLILGLHSSAPPLRPGDRPQVREPADGVHIRKSVVDPDERRAIVASLRGALAGGPSLTAGLEAERRLEREREDRKVQGTAS